MTETRCAIYCRLSREDSDKQEGTSESIQNQKALLTRYAVEQGWTIVDIYAEGAGVLGTTCTALWLCQSEYTIAPKIQTQPQTTNTLTLSS